MKIRLIIPFVELHHDESAGFACLQQAMKDNDVDLVVTSHGHFKYAITDDVASDKHSVNNFIEQKISEIQSKITKPLALGFDLGDGKSVKANRRINPFGGIDAVACFINTENSRYFYVWECWGGQNICSHNSFIDQKQRYFDFHGYSMGLLSCGDMYKYCNYDDVNKNSLLRDVDIYLNLSHYFLNFKNTETSIKANLIHHTKYVLITQQCTRNNQYFDLEPNSYKFTFKSESPEITYEQAITYISELDACFVDIILPEKQQDGQ